MRKENNMSNIYRDMTIGEFDESEFRQFLTANGFANIGHIIAERFKKTFTSNYGQAVCIQVVLPSPERSNCVTVETSISTGEPIIADIHKSDVTAFLSALIRALKPETTKKRKDDER
jgi:hypothetical protein